MQWNYPVLVSFGFFVVSTTQTCKLEQFRLLDSETSFMETQDETSREKNGTFPPIYLGMVSSSWLTVLCIIEFHVAALQRDTFSHLKFVLITGIQKSNYLTKKKNEREKWDPRSFDKADFMLQGCYILIFILPPSSFL